jgi:hypothetical protein
MPAAHLTESATLLAQSDCLADARTLDPLNLNEAMRDLPLRNRAGDVDAVLAYLETSASKVLDHKWGDTPETVAAMRDLGMLASSARRFGVEPCESASTAQSAFLILGKALNTVPRDTVFTYGPANPEGPDRRTFTELKEEQTFISSFISGMSRLDACIAAVLNASRTASPQQLSGHCEQAAKDFRLMLEAISLVRREVPAEIFTGELRPYFSPFNVDGVAYLAPGGAQMPVLVIDYLLWGSDLQLEGYAEYLRENLTYCLPAYRNLVAQHSNRPSLVSLVLAAKLPRDCVASLADMLRRLVHFRSAHLSLARANFALRSQSDLGSGGYRPDILETLLATTQDQLSRLKVSHE